MRPVACWVCGFEIITDEVQSTREYKKENSRHPSRLVPGPTHPPVQWVKGLFLGAGGKLAGTWCYPPTPTQCRGQRKGRVVPLLPLWSFMASSRALFSCLCSVCTRTLSATKLSSQVDNLFVCSFFARNAWDELLVSNTCQLFDQSKCLIFSTNVRIVVRLRFGNLH
jgi:hypothetical protein